MGPVKYQSQQESITWSRKEVKKYDKKLNSMKKYAPFLGKVVRKLEKKKIKVRTRHLSAAKAFHSLLTESTVRVRLENLLKLEKLLKSLYENKHKLSIYTHSEKAKVKKNDSKNDEIDPEIPITLCPVCKGFGIIRKVDKCFACNGRGKLQVPLAEEWWEIMFRHMCDPSILTTSKNWPKSVAINSLPSTWKGNALEITVAKLRQEFWEQKYKEFNKTSVDKSEQENKLSNTNVEVIAKRYNNAERIAVSRNPKRKVLSHETLSNQTQQQQQPKSFSTFYPMSGVTSTPFYHNPQPQPTEHPPHSQWPPSTIQQTPMDAVLSPDTNDLHLCPVCHGYSNLFTFGVCLACNGGRLLDRSTASSWWQQVMRNKSNLEFTHEQCALPYNLTAHELPTGWMGTAEQVTAARAAEMYWQHAMNQWQWQAASSAQNWTSTLNPPLVSDLPLLVAAVSLQASAEQHLVGMAPPVQTMPPIIVVPAYGTVTNKKKTVMKRTLTNIPCSTITESSATKPNPQPPCPPQPTIEISKPPQLIPVNQLPKTTDQQQQQKLLLCSFCRGHRFIGNRVCPACQNQGKLTKDLAETWWKKLFAFRTRFLFKTTTSGTTWTLPEGLKWRDLPRNWCGEGQILEESVKLGEMWEKKMKSALSTGKRERKRKSKSTDSQSKPTDLDNKDKEVIILD